MAKVERTIHLNASVDSVWELIGDFGDMSWYPGNKGTKTESVDGRLQRIVPLPGGAELREQQEDDSGKYSYSYSIASGPMPVTDYQCSLRAEPDGDGCVVIWFSTFEPDGIAEEKVVGMIAGVYETGLKGLETRF